VAEERGGEEVKSPPSPAPGERGLGGEGSLITISVSAGQANKAYPASGWTEAAQELQSRGFLIEFLGGPTDKPIEIEGTTNLVGKLSLGETLERVGASALHLCGDTGTGHMAAALGVPVVSVFGPTDPLIYRPYTNKGVVLKKGNQTNLVTPEEVIGAAMRMLE